MSKRILLVEDDSAIVETLSIFLRYEGYEPLKARSAAQAIAMLEVIRPDLVLLDYMLQDETGEPVVRAVRERYGDGVVVILITAADDPAGKRQSVGADRVVSKPFELDVLLRNIQDALEPRCDVPPAAYEPVVAHVQTSA